MISGIEKVALYVDDQKRALAFWTEQVGFSVVTDEDYGPERWIELAPPGGDAMLVLAQRPDGAVRHDVPDHLPHSPIFFRCDDILSTHRELEGRGVRFPQPPNEMPFGWWSMFEDHEGTRFALGQSPPTHSQETAEATTGAPGAAR